MFYMKDKVKFAPARIPHPERLQGITFVADCNWLRWIVLHTFKPSPRRRRILENI